MSIPIHILFPPSTQPVISKTPKTAANFVGQVVVVDRDVYIITETGEKPGYHKLQTEQSRIIIDENGRICNITEK